MHPPSSRAATRCAGTGSRCSCACATASSRPSGSPVAAAPISQASASLLTDEIKGKPLADVEAIRADDLLELLGIDISPARLKCAMLSHDTLHRVLDELSAEGAVTTSGHAADQAPTAAAESAS